LLWFFFALFLRAATDPGTLHAAHTARTFPPEHSVHLIFPKARSRMPHSCRVFAG